MSSITLCWNLYLRFFLVAILAVISLINLSQPVSFHPVFGCARARIVARTRPGRSLSTVSCTPLQCSGRRGVILLLDHQHAVRDVRELTLAGSSITTTLGHEVRPWVPRSPFFFGVGHCPYSGILDQSHADDVRQTQPRVPASLLRAPFHSRFGLNCMFQSPSEGADGSLPHSVQRLLRLVALSHPRMRVSRYTSAAFPAASTGSGPGWWIPACGKVRLQVSSCCCLAH